MMYLAKCGCGGHAYVYKCEADIQKPWSIMCEKCEIVTKQYQTKYDAVEAWNKAMRAVTHEVKFDFVNFVEYCPVCGCVLDGTESYCPDCGNKMHFDPVQVNIFIYLWNERNKHV